MNDKATIIPTVLERLGKLEVGQCLDMRTFKRNRSVAIVCTGNDNFTVVERGFHEETWHDMSAEKIKRLLKTLLKREFPRSHKIRLYTLDSFDDADVNRMGHGSGRFGA
ncbi:hypothetical protein [Oleidesulfovibrio sp.]|uniref:hypothetical protein n=1 Tax=Oleidesulfovibrio sp. TaxID=2909707 RepID=UPI003A85CB5C